jgi:hypothetical protein
MLLNMLCDLSVPDIINFGLENAASLKSQAYNIGALTADKIQVARLYPQALGSLFVAS